MGAKQTHAQKTKKIPAGKTIPRKLTRWRRHRTLWLWLFGTSGGAIALIAAIVISFHVSPWPGALVVRYFFDKGGQQTSAALEKYVPTGISATLNQHYRAKDRDAYLDVYYPSNAAASTARPTVVWVHGGAWVSGSKENVANYLKILSSHGYTTVSIGYSIAPGKHYPTPVLQVSDALHYLQANAQRLHIDPDNIALAGDSAGSQIVAQVATVITNPSYAQQLGMEAPMQPAQLKGMLLNCGAYDLTLPNYNGPDGKFLKTVLWAYSGTKDFLHDPNMQSASVIDYVTAGFPPSFITAGNADPLETQSEVFAAKLGKLGVPTDTLFYAADHQPELQHEYQFKLDLADGRQALSDMLAFLQQHLR